MMSDYLVERHIITPNHHYFDELDNLCFLSKNLYNATLYAVRQQFFIDGSFLNYKAVNKLFTHNNQVDYRALPAKVAKHTQQLVDKNYRSFFGLIKKGLTTKIPKYLHKEKGRQVVHYEKGALSLVKKGFIHLSKTNIFIKTKLDKPLICFVRVVPKGNHIVVEVGYKANYQHHKPKNNRFVSIDIGLNNLATLTSNVAKPLIFNGKPIKSINQYFNKHLAKEKSKLDTKQKTNTKKLNHLFLKRKNKITHFMHQTTRQIVNYLVSNNIDTLVIGKNFGWKQDIELGKKNNQNFVQVPFNMLISQLTYKCKVYGIEVVIIEESYTSKCSFLDNEPIQKHTNYQGKRIQRGLFKSSQGKIINADVNASLNILKKYLQEQETWNKKIFLDLVEVCSTPSVQKLTPCW